MTKTMARIKKDVPLTIFEEPTVKRHAELLFENSKEILENRYKNLLKELDIAPATELSYDNIISLFKPYFFETVLNDAVELTFTKKTSYNIMFAIYEVLTEEKLKEAVNGQPMLSAFNDAIASIPTSNAIESIINRGRILIPQVKFLGSKIPGITPILNELSGKNTQSNCCPESGCSCSCDGSCEGETKKCTSSKALSKKCNYHCHCYMEPMRKKWEKENNPE